MSLASRIDLIGYLCSRYEHPAYLEIGCRDDECFASVQALKVGVDPERGGTHRMTSDEFFAADARKFDVVFIDGLHLAAQVRRDFANSEERLNPGGVIVLHDCLPDDAFHADPQRAQALLEAGDEHLHGVGEWCGDVWRVLLELNAQPYLDVALLEADHGCGIVVKRPSVASQTQATFDEYKANYADWLTVVGDEEELEGWLTI